MRVQLHDTAFRSISMAQLQAGIVLRSAFKGHVPEVGFVGVTMAFTFLTLVGWRTALAALTSGQVMPLSSWPSSCSE